MFLSERDCITPVAKVREYLEAAGFSTGDAKVPFSAGVKVALPLQNGNSHRDPPEKADGSPDNDDTSELAGEEQPLVRLDAPASAAMTSGPPSLYIMPHLEHGAILARPAWCRRVKDAIDRVEAAALAWEAEDA